MSNEGMIINYYSLILCVFWGLWSHLIISMVISPALCCIAGLLDRKRIESRLKSTLNQSANI